MIWLLCIFVIGTAVHNLIGIWKLTRDESKLVKFWREEAEFWRDKAYQGAKRDEADWWKDE